jgi:hypothetical protein
MSRPKIGTGQDDQTDNRRARERGIKANAAFHAQMIACGFLPETKGPQGDNPTFIMPGSVSPGVRSNADF